jgi:hypothetical protein
MPIACARHESFEGRTRAPSFASERKASRRVMNPPLYRPSGLDTLYRPRAGHSVQSQSRMVCLSFMYNITLRGLQEIAAKQRMSNKTNIIENISINRYKGTPQKVALTWLYKPHSKNHSAMRPTHRAIERECVSNWWQNWSTEMAEGR